MLNKISDKYPDKIPSLNKIAEELSVVMPQFIRRMYPHMYKAIDVSPSQLFVMLTVQEEKNCNLTCLSKRLDISAPTASGLVERLVKKNYLKRMPCENDRRVIHITLSAKGDRIIKKFQKNVLEMWKRNLRCFVPQERMGPLLFIKQMLKDVEKMEKTIISFFIGISLFWGIPNFSAAATVKQGTYQASLEEITELALKNNFDIQLAKYDAFIAETSLDTAKSIFDTILEASAEYQDDESKKTFAAYGTKTTDNDYNIGLSKKFASGTTVDVDMTNNRNWTNATAATTPLNHNSSLGISVTQELGKNFFGIKDRGNVDITKLSIANSTYTSLEKIESMIGTVQKAYWDLVLQEENVRIQKEMVDQAKRLYDLHQEKLKDGLVEKPEAIASEANYKSRKNDLMLEENTLQVKQNVLKLLLNLTDEVSIVPKDSFHLDVKKQDFEGALKSAFDHRRDFLRAQNTIKSKDISLVVEKNNTLPTLNLAASLAKNGLGDHFKQSVTNITAEDNTNFSVGLTFSLPLENREAKAKLKKAEYEKAKALINLKLTERQISIEIHDQVRNCNIYKEVALNSIEVANLQGQKLEEEEKRYNLGRSDTDTLIRFQEDVIRAKRTAVADKYRLYSALVDLDLRKGTLLGNYNLR